MTARDFWKEAPVRRTVFISIILFLLASCGPSPPDRDAQATKIAAEVLATLTASAPTATQPPPSPTPAPPICDDPLGCVRVPAGTEVVIGAALALEGLRLGVEELRGLEMAVEDWGPFKGYPLSFVQEDAGCNPDGGERAAMNLVAQGGLLGVVGTTCSASAIPAAEILSAAGLVMISPSHTAPSLTDPDQREAGYFRVAPNDLWQAHLAARFAAEELKARNLATVADSSPNANALTDAACDLFQGLGGACVVQESIETGTSDMSEVLGRIAPYEPDVLFFSLFPAEGIPFIEQVVRFPGLENTHLVSTDGLLDPYLSDLTDGAADGMYLCAPSAGNREFALRYAARYGQEPTTPFAAYAYDAATLLLNAADRVAFEHEDVLYIPLQGLREALYRTTNYPGVSGMLTCTPHGDCGDRNVWRIAVITPERIRAVYPKGDSSPLSTRPLGKMPQPSAPTDTP